MRLFRTTPAIVIQRGNQYHAMKDQHWDTFFNDEGLHDKMERVCQKIPATPEAETFVREQLLPPIASQELWASGVTYYRSKVGRQEESKNSGGGDFYAKVYEAERPELFFKASGHRIVGNGGKVRIRKDSTWNVPEPELTLAITASGKIVGYTIGNDMSSRSIEGENPLYLPQAKTYDGSAALGPCIFVTKDPLPMQTLINIEITRGGKNVFEGAIAIDQIKRKFEDLVSFLYRECSFPHGSLLMTGTGIVPPNDFTLQSRDEIRIVVGPVGTLVNTVA